MKTVGLILKSERKKQEKTLQQIYKETKIPIDTLILIENDSFDKMPPATFTKGFLRNYALFLNLNPDKMLAVFRRDFIETKKGRILPKTISEDVNQPLFGFNPRTFSIISFIIVLLLFSGYFFWQLRTIIFPPKITVENIPQKTSDEMLLINGRVDREAVVTVNDMLVDFDDKKFSYAYELREGENVIEIKAIDRRKKSSEIIFLVELDKNSNSEHY